MIVLAKIGEDDIRGWSHESICDQCGAKILIECDDISVRWVACTDGTLHYDVPEYICACGNCDYECKVPETNIPLGYRYLFKERQRRHDAAPPAKSFWKWLLG